jgi:hypothetical protein
MHERRAALISLFRNCPKLVVDLLARQPDSDLPPGCTAFAGDPVLGPGLVVDAVTLMKDSAGTCRLAIAVELVDREEASRRALWTAHARALELREACPSRVAVVAVTHELAAWARTTGS